MPENYFFGFVRLIPEATVTRENSINFVGRSFQNLNVNLGECNSTNESTGVETHRLIYRSMVAEG